MEERNLRNTRVRSWMEFFSAVALITAGAFIVSLLHFRADLTEDRRYTLSEPTVNILEKLEDDIYIQVFLEGEMPIPLKRLKRSVSELLDEFRMASRRKVDFEYINPSEGEDAAKRDALYSSLAAKGLNPVDIRASDAEGGKTVKRIFPGMLVNYNGAEVPVNFLRNNPSLSYEQNILHSMEGLEYEMIQTIATLTSDTIYKVAFIEGHDELPEIETADVTFHLARYFTVDRGKIHGTPGILDNYSAVIVAGPSSEFSEADKLVIDQYLMKGGRILWLFEEVEVNADSLVYGSTVALHRPLNLEDMLFRYGARVNPAIVQDIECNVIRLKITGSGNQQFISLPWLYTPLLIPNPGHPVTRNINRVLGNFTNYIDTVGLDGRIRKTVLLSTSPLTKTVAPPAVISLSEAEKIPAENEFNRSGLPVAVLLEGVFPSAFRNRPASSISGKAQITTLDESSETRMIVVADADITRNEVRRSGLELSPMQLGQDKYTGELFGNRDFIINSLNWLVDGNGLMELRSREMKLRLLDQQKIKSQRRTWQLINVLGPAVLVAAAGAVFSQFRRKKFTA
ncbi:MAG: gliding motility-associated ABC transporter substrate-binding protein GldG [Bacteroidales bacterium]|jgi:gliding-associated putative ABC transporter substrate-binding component GldG|nr:gliding motility-associated ABC transporter substrate-binding protein GldG [Bacteroidales bacterium]